MRDEERNLITVALRLYLSGTSRKDTWSFKVHLVSVCLVSVSVSLGFGLCFFWFEWQRFGGEDSESKSPL